MATVTATFARLLAGAAGYAVSDSGALTRDGKTVFRARVDGDNRMTDADYFALVDRISDAHSDRAALVLAYADRLQIDDLGALGLAIKTAPTLRDSLVRSERYFRLATDTVRYRLDESGPLAVFRVESTTAPHAILEFRNECALAAFVRNLTRLGGEGLQFEEVSFRHESRADPDRYAAGLDCPVRFGAGEDAIAIRPDVLDLPNKLGDPAVAAFMTAHLDDEIDAMTRDDSLVDTLLQWFPTSLSNGAPTAANAARTLGLSERTLYRRLSDEGLTFQGLLQQAQQSLAKDLLAQACSCGSENFVGAQRAVSLDQYVCSSNARAITSLLCLSRTS